MFKKLYRWLTQLGDPEPLSEAILPDGLGWLRFVTYPLFIIAVLLDLLLYPLTFWWLEDDFSMSADSHCEPAPWFGQDLSQGAKDAIKTTAVLVVVGAVLLIARFGRWPF